MYLIILLFITVRKQNISVFTGLIYDIMLVAFIKSVTRRNRPPSNKTKEMFLARGPDKFSFPSGHASRAVWVALFFTRWVYPEMFILWKVLLYAWAASVCVSRVLLRRHYILDVFSGAALGFAEVLLSGLLWVGPNACKAIGDWIATAEDSDTEGY